MRLPVLGTREGGRGKGAQAHGKQKARSRRAGRARPAGLSPRGHAGRMGEQAAHVLALQKVHVALRGARERRAGRGPGGRGVPAHHGPRARRAHPGRAAARAGTPRRVPGAAPLLFLRLLHRRMPPSRACGRPDARLARPVHGSRPHAARRLQVGHGGQRVAHLQRVPCRVRHLLPGIRLAGPGGRKRSRPGGHRVLPWDALWSATLPT